MTIAVRPSRMSSPEEVLVLLLQQRLLALARVLVDDAGERRLEALDVHAALGGGDAVGVAVDALVEARVPLDGHLDLLVVLLVGEVGDLGEQRLLGRVQVLHEVDDAAGVLVGDLLLVVGPLVAEADLEALVQERHRLEPLEDRAGVEVDVVEDRGIGPERDDGAGAATRRLADDLELALGLAALGELHAVALVVTVDLEHEALAEGVHDADAHAVEAARDLVARAAELAAGVQHGEHDLGRALPLVRAPWGTGSTGMPRPLSSTRQAPSARIVTSIRGGEAGHGLVDGVVDDLPHEVVQAARTGGADVHPGALADRIEALEHLDVLGGVALVPGGFRGGWRLRQDATFLQRQDCGGGSTKSLVRGVNHDGISLPEGCHGIG